MMAKLAWVIAAIACLSGYLILSDPQGSEPMDQPNQQTSITETNQSKSEETAPEAENLDTISLRIVDGAGTDVLLLAGEDPYEVYRLRTAEIQQVFLDGQTADLSDLEDGMMAQLTITGGIKEMFPANIGAVSSLSVWSLGTAQNPGGSYYDLCGLYLQVLDDLWDRDDGLNGGAVLVSVDLSDAPGNLTEGEKSAIACAFAASHNVQPLTLSYQELLEQGYLTEMGPAYAWENGLLFSIEADTPESDEVYSLPVLKFHAMKWRTPLGAYFFSHCSAVWPELGTWSGYQIGGEIIS